MNHEQAMAREQPCEPHLAAILIRSSAHGGSTLNIRELTTCCGSFRARHSAVATRMLSRVPTLNLSPSVVATTGNPPKLICEDVGASTPTRLR